MRAYAKYEKGISERTLRSIYSSNHRIAIMFRERRPFTFLDMVYRVSIGKKIMDLQEYRGMVKPAEGIEMSLKDEMICFSAGKYAVVDSVEVVGDGSVLCTIKPFIDEYNNYIRVVKFELSNLADSILEVD